MHNLDYDLKEHFPIDLGIPSPVYKRRIIYDRDDTSPYLARFYLMYPPTMPDGSEPFDEFGRPREGIIWRTSREGLNPFLHYFYRGDSDECLHNHPWESGLSLILTGGYREERREGEWVVSRVYTPGMTNILREEDFHRVDLLDPDNGCWTLFIAGPKSKSWGFWDRHTGVFTHWVEFIKQKKERKL